MNVGPYINFVDNTREVVEYYADRLNAKVLGVMTFGDLGSESGQSSASDHLVAHAHIKVGDSSIFFSDTPADFMTLTPGNNISLMLQSADRDELQAMWDGLAADGEIIMPIGPVPWSQLYGQLVDKFGINWQLDYLDPEWMASQS